MRTIGLIFLLCCSSLISRGQNMASVFSILPSELAEELNPTLCKDLIDYYQAGVKAAVTNRFGGQTSLELLTDDYLRMNTTGHSQIQIKLLSYKDTVIVAMVNNYCVGACDGKIRFFDLSWNPLKVKHIPELSLADCIKKDADKDPTYQQISSLIENNLFKYELFPQHDSLLISWDIDPFLSLEQREKIAPFIAQKEVWFYRDKGKFVRKE